MSIDDIKNTINEILRNRQYLEPGMGEEATKHSLIIPMIKALGYNPYNPREVRPEYEADFRDKKKGQKCKVDYAIFKDDMPVILIEAKSVDESLDGHEGQIRDYFAKIADTRLGILTNGVVWQFFTDTKSTNICDSEPFFTLNISKNVDEKTLKNFLKFHKASFNPENVTDFGSELKYTAMITDFLIQELDIRDGEMSDSFLKWILQAGDIYKGRLVSSALDRFRGMGKTALQNVIGRIVRRSLSAIDDSVRKEDELEEQPQEESQSETVEVKPNPEVQKESRAVVTTDKELEAFEVFKTIFNQALKGKQIFEPTKRKHVDIFPEYKDTTSYFGICINKPSWWIMRLSFDSKIKWVGFNLQETAIPDGFNQLPSTSMAPLRIEIKGPEDLYGLRELIIKAVDQEIARKETNTIASKSN